MEGTFEFLQTLHFVQWLGEVVDPYAFAPFPVLSPVQDVRLNAAGELEDTGQLSPKNIIIQMAENETTTPNRATILVAETMGVDLTMTTFPEPTPHGFITDLDPSSATAQASDCGREQAARYLRSAFDGAAAVPFDAAACVNAP